MSKLKVLKNAGGVIKKAPLKVNPVDMVRELCSLQKEIHKYKTEAFRIESESRVRLEELNARRELFSRLIERSFSERRENFELLFQMADQAADSDKNEQLAMILEAVTELAGRTPFQDLKDKHQTRNSLNPSGNE